MNTTLFLEYLDQHLIKGDQVLAEKINAKAWIYGPGIPQSATLPISEELNKAADQAVRFQKGTPAKELNTRGWTTHHWLHFLRNLKPEMEVVRLKDLDATFGFTRSGNSEILCDWFKHTISSHYTPAQGALEQFLLRVGRRKFLTPLYARLSKNPEDLKWARAVFEKARPGYHSVTVNTIEEMLY
jgi:hypothetical protein